MVELLDVGTNMEVVKLRAKKRVSIMATSGSEKAPPMEDPQALIVKLRLILLYSKIVGAKTIKLTGNGLERENIRTSELLKNAQP